MKRTTQKISNKAYINEKEVFETYDNPHNLTFFEFKLILKTFFFVFMNNIIHNARIYKLPYKLGMIGVLKGPDKRKIIDFNLYKQGIKTQVKNYHSLNMKVKFCWVTKWPNFILPANMSKTFRYKATRENTRALAKLIKTNSTAILKYYDY